MIFEYQSPLLPPKSTRKRQKEKNFLNISPKGAEWTRRSLRGTPDVSGFSKMYLLPKHGHSGNFNTVDDVSKVKLISLSRTFEKRTC